MSKCFDVAVVGGGIVGCATARALRRVVPALNVGLLEKEERVGAHQSGHNSGVVHMGLYYKPGSLKAKLCLQGAHKAFDYFKQNNIPFRRCGKLVVAVDNSEVPRLHELFENSVTNGVPDVRLVGPEEISRIEPNCRGVEAIHSPWTSIVDWGQVTGVYAAEFTANGGTILTGFPVDSISMRPWENEQFPLRIASKRCGGEVRARYLITCGGLHSDRLSVMTGGSEQPKIIPFRGEYLVLDRSYSELIKGNIYPVPAPGGATFLGVHFTPRMDGSIWLGPNAVLAAKREGYTHSDVDLSDVTETLCYPGFLRLVSRSLGQGVEELVSSFLTGRQVKKLQRYVPSLPKHAVRKGPAGVRAQAVWGDGSLVDDFVFDNGGAAFDDRVIHVRNAPSPGATSSLAIANHLVYKMRDQFHI